MQFTRERHFVLATLLLVLAFAFAAPSAQATTITVDFPSATSTVVGSVGLLGPGEIGYFWSASRGDSVTEDFTSTGLASVTGLDLKFDVTQNVLALGVFTDWAVLVNGIPVGGWTWTDADGIGTLSLSFVFPTIFAVGDGDDFTILMAVLNEVAPGDGSIALGFPGSATLTGEAVPEPSTLLLLGAGLAGLGFARARARRSR